MDFIISFYYNSISYIAFFNIPQIGGRENEFILNIRRFVGRFSVLNGFVGEECSRGKFPRCLQAKWKQM
jgi:hypothetical protein